MLVHQIISRASYDYKTKGLKYTINFYVLNLAGNLLKYPYYKYAHKTDKFEFEGEELDYFCHWYNNTFNNERYIEIPILCKYIKQNIGKQILEVGNVTSHYFSFDHDIVDKYEKDIKVINADIVDYKPSKKYDLIFSISTMEHVGWDEKPKDTEKVIYALENMRGLLSKNGTLIVTVPKGYNPELDKHISEKKIPFNEIYYYKRISKDNRWIKSDWQNIKNITWEEKYPYANALIVGVYKNCS